MRLPRLLVVLSAVALVAVTVPAVAIATSTKGGGPERTIRAGYGAADATWNVGAAAGQYAPANASLVSNLAGDDEVDPHQHSTVKEKSYGVHSRLSVRAIVVEALDGRRVALLKSDNYLAQDLLLRRAGQLLAQGGSAVGYDDILHTASHNHSSPYYTTTSPGVFIFQDAFDQRMFEYQARAIRDAIVAAEQDLQPARMAATTVPFREMKGNVVGPATADDGSPAGYPREFGDKGLVVMRFDALVPAGRSGQLRPGDPLAVWMNFGEHPESLDGYGLTTSDFLGPLERIVERSVGAPLVFSQGDVGSAEGPYERDDTDPQTTSDGGVRAFAHAGYAQMERGAQLMADAVIEGFQQADSDAAQVPWASAFPVQAVTAWVPGPLSHPYPSVGNCRTDPTLAGNPGVGVAPDCERAGTPQSSLDLHGLPIPDQYGAPGYPAVEENNRLKLQVFRFGEVLLASCACEAQVDLILNLESRANDVVGDIFDGYDWCPGPPVRDGEAFLCGGKRLTAAVYERMKAQIHNDAAGWDDPAYAPYANSEPAALEQVKGNFTKEELPPAQGYALPVGIGHAGDYNGYTVSYREYQSRDHYRKALNAYGPHTADYMVTRLVRIAGALKGGADLEAEIHDPLAQADEARQEAHARAVGQISGPSYDAWRAALPADLGPVEAVTQPVDLQRFGAATFTWRGGSNAVDNPVVRVEREVDGGWEAYADMSGEVQTQVAFPKGVEGVADTWTGRQEWLWTAGFEVFSAFPARMGSTPEGTYRFVVDGVARTTGTDAPYSLLSSPFQVSAWTGVQVTDGQVDDGGDVSFLVPDSEYPRSYASVFRTIRDDKNRNGTSRICRTCSFRPWAAGAPAASAVVTVTRADGSVEELPAGLVDGRWVADTNLAEGDRAVIEAGAVRDAYGETNGTPVSLG